MIIALTLFGLMSITSIYIFPARIEHYTQKTLIENINNFGAEGYNVKPLGHKSYAHLFYTQKQAPDKNSRKEIETIYFSRVDRTKDSYIQSSFIEIKKIPGYIFNTKNQ